MDGATNKGQIKIKYRVASLAKISIAHFGRTILLLQHKNKLSNPCFFLNFFLDKTLSMIYFLRIAVFNMSFKEIPSNKSFVAYITGKWLVLVVGQFMLLEIRFVVKNTMTNTALKKNTLTAYKSIVSRCLEMYYNEGCHISCVITFS